MRRSAWRRYKRVREGGRGRHVPPGVHALASRAPRHPHRHRLPRRARLAVRLVALARPGRRPVAQQDGPRAPSRRPRMPGTELTAFSRQGREGTRPRRRTGAAGSLPPRPLPPPRSPPAARQPAAKVPATDTVTAAEQPAAQQPASENPPATQPARPPRRRCQLPPRHKIVGDILAMATTTRSRRIRRTTLALALKSRLPYLEIFLF